MTDSEKLTKCNHEWIHIPLSDVVDCRLCGEIKEHIGTKKLALNSNPINDNLFFPPSWNMKDFPEKTKGWIAFQIDMKSNPQYYLEQFLKKDHEKLAIAIKALEDISKMATVGLDVIYNGSLVYIEDFATETVNKLKE
jgi:hypothetical protein